MEGNLALQSGQYPAGTAPHRFEVPGVPLEAPLKALLEAPLKAPLEAPLEAPLKAPLEAPRLQR